MSPLSTCSPHLVESDIIRNSLAGLRTELDEQDRLLDEAANIARSLPHRERWLLLF